MLPAPPKSRMSLLPPANKYSLHLDRSDSYSPPLISFPGKSGLSLAVPPTTTVAYHGNTAQILSRHGLRIGFVGLTRTDECVSATMDKLVGIRVPEGSAGKIEPTMLERRPEK